LAISAAVLAMVMALAASDLCGQASSPSVFNGLPLVRFANFLFSVVLDNFIFGQFTHIDPGM
jgi:hypothetical protein